jgi:hypothetical protein
LGIWWPKPVKELVAKAFFRGCGQTLLRSWWPKPAKELLAKACLGGRCVNVVVDAYVVVVVFDVVADVDVVVSFFSLVLKHCCGWCGLCCC